VVPHTNPQTAGSIPLGSFPAGSAPPPAGPAAPPGYRVVRLLGRGGMGDVYLVHNETMDRPEVLKVVQPALLAQPEFRERFQQEVRNAAKLHHPNIVTAYCCLPVGDGLALAMEYVPGQDLYALVRDKGPLAVLAACHYIRQAALGLQHAHEKRMVHRDVKPHNLMLGKDGTKPVVKVLDFGLAKVIEARSYDGGLTGTGQMMGTPEFIAPEQILDAAKADIRADVYSLGCTLYYLLAGHSPFPGLSLFETLEAHHYRDPRPLHTLRPDAPTELDAVVAKMMAKDPADRYQTPAEVAIALHPFLKGKGTKTAPARAVPYAEVVPAAGPAAGSTVPARPAPRRKWVRGLAGGVAAGLVLAAVGLWAGGVFKPAAGAGVVERKTDPPDGGPESVVAKPKPPDPKPLGRPLTSAQLGFGGRTGAGRAHQLELWGGTKGSEEAVALGLAWLYSRRKADGSWVETAPTQGDPVATTGLALLAFLGAGHTHQSGDYKDAVAAGLDYLIARQKSDGAIRTDPRSSYAHTRAATALCEALGMTGDKGRLLGPARKAIDFIVTTQAADGGWGLAKGEPGNLLHVVAHVEALVAARMTREIAVPAETWRRASKYLDGLAAGPAKGRFGYNAPDPLPPPTALGLYVRFHADGWGPDTPGMADGVRYLLQQPPPKKGTFDPARLYYQTQLLRYHAGDAWHKTWNPAVRDLVVGLRSGSNLAVRWDTGDFLGSDPPGQPWVAGTCYALLVLETYYRQAVPAK
jgi:hypothetical protein